jgi:hypothetical protein
MVNKTRKELAAREGITDAASLCDICCCGSCYIAQELAHIKHHSRTGNPKVSPSR